MRYLSVFALLILAACTLQVNDARTDIERSATQTARPVPPLPGGVIRFRLHITPTPLPDWEYTVTPTPGEAQ